MAENKESEKLHEEAVAKGSEKLHEEAVVKGSEKLHEEAVEEAQEELEEEYEERLPDDEEETKSKKRVAAVALAIIVLGLFAILMFFSEYIKQTWGVWAEVVMLGIVAAILVILLITTDRSIRNGKNKDSKK